MSDMAIQAALEEEHRQIDSGIEAFMAQPADTTPLLQAMDALRRHIYLEEDFLFPPLREAGLVVPILVMIREHGEIWQAMDRITELLDKNAPQEAVIEACQALLQLQEVHNAKEEPIIYPQADLKLSFDLAARLQAYIDSSTLPEGWVCQALG